MRLGGKFNFVNLV